MKKNVLAIILIVFTGIQIKATIPPPDEGMWLPMLMEELNYADMKKMGLNIAPDKIYSETKPSLKDAIVGLNNGSPAGNFCTGEIVSPKGLILTNHHCGYHRIQAHSTVENDYLSEGFWARKLEEELPNPGMCASILVRMDDVTKRVMAQLNDEMTESERSVAVKKEFAKIKEEASEEGKYDVIVKSFYHGNEYYMFVYQTYKDVRLVGAPPSSIGKFGGDTDNWMWPRHTGDFSMFRIYTAPDGSPATYSEENIPLTPKYHLPISLKGVDKKDFSMVWGFPGSTQRFLTSYGVKLAIQETNPTIVGIRDKKLEVMKEDMNADPKIRIMYASKYAGTANYWKYYKGQTKGLKRLDVYDKKKQIEDDLKEWINSNEERKAKYGEAIKLIEQGYDELKKINLTTTYMEEAVLRGAEFVLFARNANKLYEYMKGKKKKDLSQDTIEMYVSHIKSSIDGHFKDYNKSTDRKIFAALTKMYYDNVAKENQPGIFETITKEYDGNLNEYAEELYEESIFVDEEKIKQFVEEPGFKTLEKDPGYKFYLSIKKKFNEMRGSMVKAYTDINHGKRLFVDALRKMKEDKTFYPNANSTLRVSYGQVLDYYPADAVHYDFVTTLKGVMEKEDTTTDEFIVPEKLKTLYKNKNYGKYGENDKMITCFISNNDITGGNSGSPVINGNGELIGIAFDGNWEAMSGDIAFEPELQRTINVDIRYVMFIIDKFAGATNLIDEMTLREKKQGKKVIINNKQDVKKAVKEKEER